MGRGSAFEVGDAVFACGAVSDADFHIVAIDIGKKLEQPYRLFPLEYVGRRSDR
jgi:hypothetical protein